MDSGIESRLALAEKRIRRQNHVMVFAFTTPCLLLIVVIIMGRMEPTPPVSVSAAELVVVDRQGTPRVRIGGDLPDAIINGKAVPRGEKAAGILLYDSTGQERGGYVTWEPSGNVGLTLDTRKGQTALFVADPNEGTALQIWHSNDLIELRSDGDGSRLTAVKDGLVAYQQPAIVSLDDDACAAYREALAQFSVAEVMTACRKRYPVDACDACLSQVVPAK